MEVRIFASNACGSHDDISKFDFHRRTAWRLHGAGWKDWRGPLSIQYRRAIERWSNHLCGERKAIRWSLLELPMDFGPCLRVRRRSSCLGCLATRQAGRDRVKTLRSFDSSAVELILTAEDTEER